MIIPGSGSRQRRSRIRISSSSISSEYNTKPQVSTVEHLLQKGTARLHTTTDAPRVEAEVLMMYLLEASRAALLAHPERLLTTDQQVRYERLVSRRASGYPLPYITGRAEFYGLELEVTPDVMIPRPETETMVDLALERRPSTVVDVGTGSGCIAIALAANLPDAVVYATEISSAALAIARSNVERHGLGDRVCPMLGDVLSPRPNPVDLIISNPPYISREEWPSLPEAVRDHEPRLALDGGPDGLEVIRELLAQSQGLLRPNGRLLIEMGADQGGAARRLASARFPEGTVRVHPDLAGRDRVLEVRT